MKHKEVDWLKRMFDWRCSFFQQDRTRAWFYIHYNAVSPSIRYLWLFSTNDVHCCFQELKKPIAKMISRAAFLIGSVLKTGCLEICLQVAPGLSNHLTQSWPFNPAPPSSIFCYSKLFTTQICCLIFAACYAIISM